MNNVNCPYCNKENEVNHEDGHGYAENVKHEQNCNYCGKNFVFETTVILHYKSFKADCLNGGKHKYKLSHTHPSALSTMNCQTCDEKRDLTEKERKYYKLMTPKEYIDLLLK